MYTGKTSLQERKEKPKPYYYLYLYKNEKHFPSALSQSFIQSAPSTTKASDSAPNPPSVKSGDSIKLLAFFPIFVSVASKKARCL